MAATSSVEQFSVEEYLKEVVRNPCEHVCTLFAGAGISVDSGLPNFASFGKNMIGSIIGESNSSFHFNFSIDSRFVSPGESKDVLEEKELDKLLLRLRPEVLLQSLADTFGGARMSEFSEWLKGTKPNPAHFFYARALQAGHMVGTRV